MGAPHTIRSSWPSVCQKLLNLTEIRQSSVQTINKLGNFFWLTL